MALHKQVNQLLTRTGKNCYITHSKLHVHVYIHSDFTIYYKQWSLLKCDFTKQNKNPRYGGK